MPSPRTIAQITDMLGDLVSSAPRPSTLNAGGNAVEAVADTVTNPAAARTWRNWLPSWRRTASVGVPTATVGGLAWMWGNSNNNAPGDTSNPDNEDVSVNYFPTGTYEPPTNASESELAQRRRQRQMGQQALANMYRSAIDMRRGGPGEPVDEGELSMLTRAMMDRTRAARAGNTIQPLAQPDFNAIDTGGARRTAREQADLINRARPIQPDNPLLEALLNGGRR